MKLKSKVFLSGPNVNDPESGLVVRLELEAGDEAIVAWRPSPETANAWLTFIRMGFPMTPMAALARTPEQIAGSTSPFCELVFTLFDYLTQNVTVRRGFGRIIGRDDGALTLFLPCEDRAIGEVVLGFNLGVAATMAARGDAPGPLPASARDRFAGLLKGLAMAAPGAFELDVARAAAARGIPWQRLGHQSSLMLLGQGAAARRIYGGRLDDTGRMASDDHAVLLLLKRMMLPVPDWRTFNSPDQAARLAKALTFPLCLRPRSGQGGVEVADEAALTAALATFKGGGILEALGPGADVRLRIEAGRSDGSGDAHLDNLRLAEIAVRAAGLRDAYVIYRAADPSVSWRAAAGVFRQLTPIAPTPPPSQPTFSRTPGALLKDLFLPGADGRIPTAGVTGSMGKTTTCGMTAAILARAGLTVARTATQGVWLGADQIASGDKAGGRRAAGLLFDPAVQAGVFELSRGGLIKRGMSLDAVDVGVVLGVQDNHVGIDGVSTREDLAAVKSLVVRHARKLAILNADDPLCLKMREVVTAERLCLVSTAPENPALDVHAAAGGMTARLVQAGERHDLAEIRLFEGGALVGAMTAAEIPASMGGLFTPFLISALYATAISHGLGIGFDTIRSGLSGFESNVTTNPNRMNTMEGLPFKLWATWAEGPAAFAALAQLASRIPARRKTFMLSMMGNRPDLFLRETAGAAAAAGGFDDFICSDAVELRGRPPGEVAQLLATGLRDQGVSDDRITVVSHHSDAIAAVVSRIQPDDLLIVVSQRAGTGHLFRALEPMKIPPSS